MPVLYHVTPLSTWIDHIQRGGLALRNEKRGKHADSDDNRIYLFEDVATAEDGLSNWLADEFPNAPWFALLAVDVPDEWLHQDPELEGSFYIEHSVPPAGVWLARKIDAR